MTRLRGRAKDGKRLVDSAPCGSWKATTMISSISSNGQTHAMAIEGATTMATFEAYIEQVLSLSLQVGDVVIMDNLSAHKSDIVKAMIEEKGAILKFLPPYSPDLNPIEKMWSKVKEHLRDAKARGTEMLYEKIGEALNLVTAENAKGWFKSCGYVLS